MKNPTNTFLFLFLAIICCMMATPVPAASPYANPDRTGYDRFTIPWIDLAECPEMQVIVDKEEGQYLGHWEQGKSPYIMTVRFKLSDLDRLPQKVDKALSPQVGRQVVFRQEVDGYKNIRIPAICATNKGTLLAFAEGRTGGDAGKIEMLLRRSEDEGKTWSPISVIWKDGENTCGNPTPLVDRETGTVWLFGTWSLGTDHEKQIMDGSSKFARIPYMMKSENDGRTWSKAEPMPHLRKDDWCWYACGPCNGIQLTRGPHRGRLVIPANHSVPLDQDNKASPGKQYRSHIIYSDDHGKSWQLGGIQESYTNESTAVELEDGSVMQNMRSYHGKGCRAVAISRDGGATFPSTGLASGKPGDEAYLDTTLNTPVCQASILRYSWRDGDKPGIILFSSPQGTKRENLTIWMSLDDAKRWKAKTLIYSGPVAYSNLIALKNGKVGILVEIGDKGPYETISFLTLPTL